MKIAFLTAGGIAPCLSSSIARLIYQYSKSNLDIKFYGYLNGYKGLLLGHKVEIPYSTVDKVNDIYKFGGTFLGNSRVKLSNINDCIKNKYVKKDENPFEVAANQLIKDKIDILHTIGGDDTNTTAAELVQFLKLKEYELTVVGLPKTIDNDIYPISQTLGSITAADQTAKFFKNIINENTTSTRQLIIHEVMGRNCGWLTAYSAYLYRKNHLKTMHFIPEININKDKWDIHAIYIPELQFNLNKESNRLLKIMNKYDCVNIFLSEGAGIKNIIDEKKKLGEDIKKDAFGHVRLDEINPGIWYANYFKNKLQCDKVLVQKSGYFSRSAAPNKEDLNLIFNYSDYAVKMALKSNSGVVGIDETTNKISCISFDKIKGNKLFNIKQDWFKNLLRSIKQSN